MTPIVFGKLRDAGLECPPLLGQFWHDQLVACRVDRDGDRLLEWARLPGESAAEFEDRILADLKELVEA